MIRSLSNKFAEMVLQKQLISENERIIIAFGIETMVMKALHLCASMLIGMLFGKVSYILVFYLFFVFLRTYAGGHHAKSSLVCFFSSCGIAVITLTFWIWCPDTYKTLCMIAFLAVSVPIIWFLAPVEATNKPLDEAETRVYRRKARIFLLIEIAIVALMYFIGFGEIALVGATALSTLSIMLVFGKLKMHSALFQSTRDDVRINKI